MLIIWQKQKRNMLIKHDARILPKLTEFVETLIQHLSQLCF